MRIAMIGQKGLPAIYGGVEQHVHELAAGLVSHGHSVTAYARTWYTGGNTAHVNGVTIQHVPTLHTKHLDTIVHTLFATIHAINKKFDVIHYHGVGPALLAWIPRLFAPKTKVIVTFHSIDRYHQKWGLIAKLMLRCGEWAACRFPHQTIAVSQGLKQYTLNEYNTNTVYIPNGVETKTEIPSTAPLAGFHIEAHKYLVMVSRLVPHKGAHLLIEAFNRLKRDHADSEEIRQLKLVIVGGSVYTDEYVAALHQLAASANDVIFTGFQSGDTLAALYAHAKLLVHPSLNEGLPMTVLGAMSYGKPVLLSNIPEHIELVTDSRVIFEENNVAALESKLYQWLMLDPEEQKRMGERNRDMVEKRYEWKQIVPQIAAIYEQPLPTLIEPVKSTV